nr:CDP-alcohol phosphatidyltransferase family protein [Streptomyces sp. C8S0]
MADGRLARHQHTASPFGDYADSFADAAFWTWLTLRHEPSRAVRAAAITAWALPIATVTAIGIPAARCPSGPAPPCDLRPRCRPSSPCAASCATDPGAALTRCCSCCHPAPTPGCLPPRRPARTRHGS